MEPLHFISRAQLMEYILSYLSVDKDLTLLLLQYLLEIKGEFFA